jgi:hypothetical protein
MTTATTTSTITFTRTHTATYLADAVLGAISDLLAHLGIPISTGTWDHERNAKAIAAWIKEESLKEVVLECHRPDGTVAPVFEFPIRYTADVIGDAAFTTSTASLAKYRAKIAISPPGTTFRLFCTFRGAYTPQPGWTSGTRASTSGLRTASYGTLASAPHAAASLRYLH